MRILITGGFGFIASHCAAKLLQNNEITIISKSSKIPDILDTSIEKINIINGSYEDSSILDDILPKIDIVLHAACTTVPENSTKNPIFDIESNVIPFLRLLEHCIKSNVKKIVYLSSGGVVYGDTKKKFLNELELTNPVSSYGITKLTIEKYLQCYSQIYGYESLIFRIGNAYGPHQITKNNQGVIANWLEKCKNNQDIEIWGDGEIVRDYVFIDDIVNAVSIGIEKNIVGLYNIGSSESLSLKELARLIINITSSKSNIKFIEDKPRPFDVLFNQLDTTLYQSVSGWKPIVKIKEGIIKCYKGI